MVWIATLETSTALTGLQLLPLVSFVLGRVQLFVSSKVNFLFEFQASEASIFLSVAFFV